MEFLDIFSKNKIQFTNLNSAFKTRIGGVLTIIQVIFSIIIIVILGKRKFENKINAYYGNFQNFKDYEYKFLIKYPKKFVPHFHWIDDYPLQLSTSVNLCSNEEYSNFYNNTKKDEDFEYFCKTSYNNVTEYSYLVNCTDITYDPALMDIADKVGCDYELTNLIIDYSDYKGEYWISYKSYNESLVLDEVDEVKVRYDFTFDTNNYADLRSNMKIIYLNTNIFIDDLKMLYANNLEFDIFGADYFKFSLVVLQSLVVDLKQTVYEKLDERLIIILSTLGILNVIFSLMANYFTEFYFQIHVLETCFQSEEYIEINEALNLKSRIKNNGDLDKSNSQEYLENIKEQVFHLTNYIIKNYTNNKDYEYVENLINDKISLERMLGCELPTNNSNPSTRENEGITKSFLNKFDLFSSPTHLRLKKLKVVKSLYGALLSIILFSISVLIIYYFANNFLLNKNPKVNAYIIENNNDNLKREDPHINMLLKFTLTQEFSRMTIPVIYDFDTGKYKNITYRSCTQEEISSIPNNFTSDLRLAHICINYYDLVGNVFRENPKINNEIHWVNCTELSYLGYKEFDCEVDLLEFGSPLYFRLDFYSNEVNPYEENYLQKIPMYYELNKIYDYNLVNKQNFHSYSTFASTRQINTNKNKFFLDYQKTFALSIDSLDYITFVYFYRANLFFAHFGHKTELYIYNINYGLIPDTLSVCQTLISLISFILYIFYFLYGDYSILNFLINNLKNKTILEQFSNVFLANNNNSNLISSIIHNNDSSNKININNENNHISFQKLLHLGNKASIIEDCNNGVEKLNKNNRPNDEIEMKEINNDVVNDCEDEEKIKQDEIKAQEIKKLINQNLNFWEYVKHFFSSNNRTNIDKMIFKVLKIASFEYLINKNFYTSKLMLTPNNSNLKKLDFLTEHKNFTSISKNAYKPIIGGMLSIIYLLVIIPVVYYIGYDFFFKTNPIISSQQVSAKELENRNNTQFNNLIFDFTVYEENQFDDFNLYFWTIANVDIFTCKLDDLVYYFNLTEKSAVNEKDYKCLGHNLKPKNEFYLYQNVFAFVHKCFNPEKECDLPTNNFTIGFATGFTQFNIDAANNYLENIRFTKHFNLRLLDFPYIRFDFRYNLVRNDIGIYGDSFEEYFYLSNPRSEISKSRIFFDFECFEFNLVFDEKSIIYTRKYKHLSDTVRESFSILLLISVVFKAVTNFINDYYYEQYLIDILYQNYAKNEITKYTIKVSKDTLYTEAAKKESFKYKLSFWNYTFSELPLMSFLADNEYLNIKSEVLEKVSIENILK